MTAEELARQRDEDLRWVLSTEQGRRFYLRLLEDESNLQGQSFAGSDTHLTAFREGVRAVGISLLEEAQRVAPGSYMKALNEAHEALSPRTPEKPTS